MSGAFNTKAIVFDNTPWRPGRDINIQERNDDERKLKNLATRIMSNGVEVLVRDKSSDGKHEQRKLKVMSLRSSKPDLASTPPTKSLLSSAITTVVNKRHMSALFPVHQLMRHNYIIKTCMTTYTYLTTVVQNKRSAISTFETIVSVVTTESLTNLYATDVLADLKPTKTKYMDVKTIQPSGSTNMFLSNIPKLDKRIDSEEDGFDIIQPSEINHVPCSTSCPCSHTQTEMLKTKYVNNKQSIENHQKYNLQSNNFSGTTVNVKPHISTIDSTKYQPYEYETSSQAAPTDKIVEKYTQVNDYSDEKDSNSVENSDLLTNEQAPAPLKNNKTPTIKTSEKIKPDKPQKVNKNKLVVAELIKLGSLGIKGLSQLAPVIEKMTGGFMRRQEVNKTTPSTTTLKPANKITTYNANKRIDNEAEFKIGNFPIYIPVDEMETSESQISLTNATLHQNFAWATEHKNPLPQLIRPKIVYESPLLNGGIPISPGEIITANSDVIVGKPAVGGPLTFIANGIQLQNNKQPPVIDNAVANNEIYITKVKPLNDKPSTSINEDDSFDLRPPGIPKFKPQFNKNVHQHDLNLNLNHASPRLPPSSYSKSEHHIQSRPTKAKSPVLISHGRPAFLDYVPSSSRPHSKENHADYRPYDETKHQDISDNSPSSSEIVSSKITTEGEYALFGNSNPLNKPFLVDIQPSRVANVVIPHGSSTALVFAGSSEPHKTGDYVDDPLPYPEPGYFGSFSIDAPQMTNVHNVIPNKNQFFVESTINYSQTKNQSLSQESKGNNEIKWKDNKRPNDLNKTPPPTSNQEMYVRVGPQITAYNPEIYKNFDKHIREKKVSNDPNQGKEVIDKEYENYLAVPPPPPKLPFNQDNRYEKNKYHQRPTVHTKPVVDSNVFLKIQHPITKQQPPKVTSEIFFASQVPNNHPPPTYTKKMPSPATIEGTHSNLPMTSIGQYKKSYNSSLLPKLGHKTSLPINNSENTYSITLNTATNIATDNSLKQGHLIGSSISVPITTTSLTGQMNADIPIGTNFAIRVEDDPTKYDNVVLHGKRQPSVKYQGSMPTSDFKDYKTKNVNISNIIQSTKLTSEFKIDHETNTVDKLKHKNEINVVPPTLNSHANFPMINERFNEQNFVKSSINTSTSSTERRPSQFLPNISTNSHGWFASILNQENLKNIKVEATTRKIIPLNHDVNSDSLPVFGEKIKHAGKPPTEFWNEKKTQHLNNFSIGKPFSKSEESSYIPSIESNSQIAYDIPTKETYETTPYRPKSTEKNKTIYETAEEIYDGEDVSEYSEFDSEVSSESMKVPIITSSNKQGGLLSRNVSATEFNRNKQNVKLVDFNPGTQTEKPFSSPNITSFQSNRIQPIYSQSSFVKPRPFTINSATPLDHQLHQPHWQINQLMENITNVSYEDSMDLNKSEEMYDTSTRRTNNLSKPTRLRDKQQLAFDSSLNNSTKYINESNIITSTVHIQDKKPLILDVHDKSTLPTFTIRDELEINSTSSEILDLSPPPPYLNKNNNFIQTSVPEIMGMSPPPPKTSVLKYTSRTPPTPRPILPVRASPPYRTLPPRTLPPKQITQKPLRKPVRDDVSTYRPAYDIINKIKRPYLNKNLPSLHLLPPPRHVSMVASTDKISSESPTTNVIFPTSVSTRWLASSNIEFPTSNKYSPTSINFSDTISNFNNASESDIISFENISENIHNSNEYETSSEIINISYQKPVTEKIITVSKQFNITFIEKELVSSETELEGNEDSISFDTSQENNKNDRIKVIAMANKNRTRKPYPARNDDSKTVISRFKPNSKSVSNIKPTRTLSRPDSLYPTRYNSIKNIIQPLSSKPSSFIPASIIEGSESSLEENYIKPTEVLDERQVSTPPPKLPSIIEKTVTSTLTISHDVSDVSNILKTHHAGNEIKISDDMIPTKTEFKTTVITLTKTLSEPPQIISSIGYINLTHTLTVTHTETSLVSQSDGAITETLVLTNIHTSTVVDVVTEVYTQVQPTTIVETVTKHIPVPQLEATPVTSSTSSTKIALDDVTMSSEESDNFIIKDEDSNVTENFQKVGTDEEKDNETFFVVLNKSQSGGKSPPISTDIDSSDYDGITRNEQVNNNGVSQVLFGEILLAGTPFSETTNVRHPIGAVYGKECQPDCKASRNERCQRIDGIMKCVCRPGFARMFPDRPCKPTYTYSVRLALGSQGKERLKFHSSLSDNSTKEYHNLAVATHEGINRMVMQSDLRDVYHGVHITGFYPIEIKPRKNEPYEGVNNDFYVQLSDNAHETRLKEVIEKYLRNNNYSLGGTEVYAAEEYLDRLNVSDFDECTSTQFHDCSEHARCFNLRGTYTCSCLEGFADLSVNTLYPGRICSSDTVGCAGCNYHGTCFERESAMICECFKWYAGRTCQVNLKAVLITVTVAGAVIILAVTIWASKKCCSPRSPATQTFVIGCMQGMPTIHQGNIPSKQRADRRALIGERMEVADSCSVQNASLPYIPSKSRSRSSFSKKITVISDPPAHAPPPPPPAPALMIPRARLHPSHSDSRDNLSRKKSNEVCSEAKLISYLESGVSNPTEEMRRKHSMESSYSNNKERSGKQGALVSAGFKVSTTVRPDDSVKEDGDDASSINKTDLEDVSRFDTLRKTYSQEDMSEWTDAERRIGELTLSEARSIGGTLPASTGRAASSTRLTHQEANTMAERDLGSTFLLPHVHLYKPDLTSDVSEFDSL